MCTHGSKSKQMDAMCVLMEAIQNKWTQCVYLWKQFRTNGRYVCTHGSKSEQMDAMCVLKEANLNKWTLCVYSWKQI